MGTSQERMGITIPGENDFMAQITKEELQEVIRETFEERNTIGGERHHTDHEFIQFLKDREERRAARVEKFKLSLIGTLATMLVGAAVWIGKLVVDYWHNGS